jgi:hypothetical protein
VRANTKNLYVLAMLMLALVLVLAPLPMLGIHVMDRLAGYSGTVVDKGTDSHYLIFGPLFDPYLVIQDSNDRRERRYVSRVEHASAKVGTYVVKPWGWFSSVRRPGQLGTRALIDSLRALNRTTDRAKRDSLIAHIRR